MGVSGIIVAVRPGDVDRCVGALEALPGVDTHQIDRSGGRVVVTHEADDLAAHEAGLRRIQGLEGVLFAELVYHLVAGDGPASAPAPPGPAPAADRSPPPDPGS